MNPLLDTLESARLYDLAQPYFVGMPHHPTHPPFLYSLIKRHGDYIAPGGVSSAADSIALGTHVGTHIDALCHFSRCGFLYGGVEANAAQSYAGGLQHAPIDEVGPIFRRGVLLDLAKLEGCHALPVDFTITPEHLEAAERIQNVQIRKGDIVLLRTGWARYWHDPVMYLTGCTGATQVCGPGPALPGAQWLSKRGIFAAGSDTVAFERVPDASMPVHVHLLVESGIHIIEALNLEELAEEKAYEFVFAALPLKIRGATGSPIRPVAIVS